MGKKAEIFGALAALFLCAPATAGADEQVEPWQVLSVVTTDWTDDGGMDRAVLYMDDSNDAALAIYVGDGHRFDLRARHPDIAWFGAMWGTLPSLGLSEAGSLLVHSGNEEIGRNRWSETLTIAYRGGAFVIAGYTYRWYDTLDPENNGLCDVNFLSGRGEITRGEAAPSGFSFRKGGRTLERWSRAEIPPDCS